MYDYNCMSYWGGKICLENCLLTLPIATSVDVTISHNFLDLFKQSHESELYVEIRYGCVVRQPGI